MEDCVSLDSAELQRIFPRRWLSGALCSDEVQEVLGLQLRDAPADTQAVIGVGWTPARAARFIHECTKSLARHESWRARSDAWVMSLHRMDKPSAEAPLGFIGFRPEVAYQPERGSSLQFRLNLDLVWVVPAVRALGYGLHLIAHLLRYLESNPVPASHFGNALTDLEVTIARPEEQACRWCASKLAETFEQDRLFAERADAQGLPLPAWPVLDVHVTNDD